MNAAALRKFDCLAARAGEGLWPGKVTISGVEYPVESREPELIGEVEEGGELEEGELVVKVRKEVLAVKPVRDTVVLWRGKRFRIREVNGDEAASARWTLVCERDA